MGGGWGFQRVTRKFQAVMLIIQLQGQHHRWAHASKLIKRYPLNMSQAGDRGSLPRSERSPGAGNGNPLQSILAWETPWTEKPGGLQSTQSQGVGQSRARIHPCNPRAKEGAWYMVPAQQMLTLNGNDQMNGLNKRKIYILAVELRSGLKKKNKQKWLMSERIVCFNVSGPADGPMWVFQLSCILAMWS